MNPINARRLIPWAALPALFLLNSTIEAAHDGVMTALVEAGRAGSCVTAPCQLYFQMPPGSGEWPLLVNGFDLGRHPAGQVVNLGDYNDRTVRIQVPGSAHPLTLVHIPSDNSR